VNAAESDGYFQKNPADKVFSKSNPSTRLKDNLEIEEYHFLKGQFKRSFLRLFL